MANVLEGLVAKGRRVNHIREQREVAFGLADLSTHQELHQRIVKKGGVKTLIHLLTTSRDVEAQRFAALALANTSCAELHRVEIASQEDSLRHLTDYVKDGDADLLGRQYCAMALGNLAADPDNHIEIVKIGGIEALVLLLKLGAEEEDPETGRYAAFALSNLASNSKHRKQIVEEGAISALIAVACGEDLNVQRQALNVLRGLCINFEYRAIAVQSGILDPLVLIARSHDLDILREVAAALNCLSSVPENKIEVADRAISTIIVLMLSGDQIIERHACCTMANLAEMTENHPRILEEDGLPPLVSMFSSNDLNSKGEAARALANLSSNATTQQHLVTDEILQGLVEALTNFEVNCQRYAALCLANLATTVSSQIHVVQAGAIEPLISLVERKEVQLECRRYACLAIANLSATVANHSIIFQLGGLNAMFVLSNSPDVMSQYYVGCTLANLSSNIENHNYMIEHGGIQPLVSLAYSPDPDVHTQATAALRGLSASDFIKMKLVQEGALEPLSRLLLSRETELLREVTACLCNLSLGDENKIEIGKSGVVPPLITMIQSEDLEISSFSCACLANLAEVPENQELIASEGGIKPVLWVMRSHNIEVQREGGRLLANLCACNLQKVPEIIVENGGHKQLISFLLSRDLGLQRVGAFGVGNLCTHECHRVTLRKAGILEPLATLVRSEGGQREIRRFAMLGIVNLAAEVENHETFVEERILQLLISLSNSSESEIRQYAAVCVVNIATNMEMRNFVTNEGGLEPVLFLARTDDVEVRRKTLPAITTLSFVDRNKRDICQNGGLDTIIQEIQLVDKGQQFDNNVRLACCATANLTENLENIQNIVESNMISLLRGALYQGSSNVRTEAARALGNLSANLDYGEIIVSEKNFIPHLVSFLATETVECQRMVSMALANISTNAKLHHPMIQNDIVDILFEIFRVALEPKSNSDIETSQYCLLLVANLSCCSENHSIIVEKILVFLTRFTRHRDIRCRQNAVITLGNLCSNPENLDALGRLGTLEILISFSFPPMDLDTTNAQFQAISGVRGFATNKILRNKLVNEGCIEPLILGAGNEGVLVKDIEVRREAAAAMYNLALSADNGIGMAQSGVVSALVSLIGTNDIVGQIYAFGTLANLAERENKVQSKLIHDGCLAPLICHVENRLGNVQSRKEVSRCFALFAYNMKSHEQLMSRRLLKSILELVKFEKDVCCRRYCVHALANLSIFATNHSRLLEIGILSSLNDLVKIDDIETKRCVAFAFHNITKNDDTHVESEKWNVATSLAILLGIDDYFTQLHSCLSLKFLSVSNKARAQFVDCEGLTHLFSLAENGDYEMKRETAAVFRNLSISDRNKVIIIKDRGMEVLTYLCRLQDNELCHQACGVLANLAEVAENQEVMMKEGILHHLKFIIRSNSDDVLRESLRTIANLSSDVSCCEVIPNDGGLTPLIRSLSSDDHLCKRFATMAISNLATISLNRNRIVEEGGIQPLLDIASDSGNHDVSKRHAFFALSNLSSSKTHHDTLVKCGIIALCVSNMDATDMRCKSSAALCLSNLASNRCNHPALQEAGCLQLFFTLLNTTEREIVLRAVAFFRGLSANVQLCDILLRRDLIQNLLNLAVTHDIEIQTDTLATLCNLSLGGYISDDPEQFIQKVDVQHLISFLCSSNATSRLFGAISLGNIASSVDMQESILDGGILNPLIHVANTADLETQRCIAYALCNLCRVERNRLSIVREGGLIPIFSLAYSDDECDVLTAVSTIRGLSNTSTIRHIVVTNGGLEPLFYTLGNNRDIRCQHEAITAIAALSLHDENKTAIVKNTEFHQIMRSTILEDPRQTVYSLRVLANCAENPALHFAILGILYDFIHNCDCLSNIHICEEMSRLFVNLSSNPDVIDSLINMKFPNKIIDMQEIQNERVTCNLILAFHNLSVDRKCQDLFRQDLVSFVIHNCVTEKLHSSVDRSKIKRYACLVLGNLLQCEDESHNSVNEEMIQVLESMLEDNDLETRFNATFGMHQFALKFQKIHEESYALSNLVKSSTIEMKLLEYISTTPQKLLSHALSTIRLLSVENSFSSRILTSNGCEVLFNSSQMCTNEEVLREIAATFCHLTIPQSNKLEVVNSSAIRCIFDLLTSNDTETARFALGAAANIAEDPLSHEKLLSKGIVKILIAKTHDKRLCVKRESIRGLSNLLTSELTHKLFFGDNGLESLANLSASFDIECQYSTSLSLHKLASSASNHEFMMLSGIHHSILKLSKLRDNFQASRQALSALREMSSNRKYKVSIAEKGGLQVAQDLLSSSDLELKILAASTLQHLSISSLLKQKFYSNGTLQDIVNCSKNSNDESLLYNCIGALSNLSEHLQVRKYFWKKGIVDVLVQFSRSPSIRVKELLARTTNYITSIQYLNEIENEMITKVMEISIHLLSKSSSDQSMMACYAASTTGNLAIDDVKQRMLCKLGVFQPLSVLLESSQKNRLSSCRSLSRLSASYENKLVCCGNEKLLQQLIRLLDDEDDIARFAVISLCNLSICEESHKVILMNDGIASLLSLIRNASSETVSFAVRTLCNLGRNTENHQQIVNEGALIVLSSLLQHDDKDCIETSVLALGNLCVDRKFNQAIISTGPLRDLASIMNESCVSERQIAVAKIVFNLSTSEDCHLSLVKSNVIESAKNLCKSQSATCRLSAIMTLSNISANKLTRNEAIRNGGLQAAVIMLKDSDDDCKINASICLTNMSNNENTQRQIVVHGGLPLLTQNLLRYDNAIVQKSSIMCLINLASNKANHEAIIRQGTYRYLTELSKNNFPDSKVFSAYAICNLLANDGLLDHIGSCDGIPPLLSLGKSSNSHCQCIALAALRRLASTPHNRKRLMDLGVLTIIRKNGFEVKTQIKQEVAALLCNLSRDENYLSDIFHSSLNVVNHLMKSDNPDTIAHAVGTFGNLAENNNHHSEIKAEEAIPYLMKLLRSKSSNVRREAVRSISNLLSSQENHSSFIANDMSPLVELTGDDDRECQFNAVLSCRKLVVNTQTHHVLLTKGLKNFFSLLKSEIFCTIIQIAAILRDLSANTENQEKIVAQGGIAKILILVKSEHNSLKSLGLACLRHLSCNNDLKKTILLSDVVTLAINSIMGAEANLLSQIAGLLANLSEEIENHIQMINEGVIPAILTLSRTEKKEIIQDVARALANLSTNEHKQLAIYQQGAMSCLIHLRCHDDPICRRYITLAIQILTTNMGVCRAILKEQSIESLLKLSTLPHIEFQRTSAVVMKSITSYEIGKIELSQTDYIQYILELCARQDLQIQRDAASTLANISDCCDSHDILVHIGAVQVMANLSESCSDYIVVQEISRFFSFITLSNEAKEQICKGGILSTILKYSRRSDILTQRYSTLALCNLCLSKKHKSFILQQHGTVNTLVYLTRCPDLEVNRCTILSLASLMLAANLETKQSIASAGAMKQVSKSLQYPDTEIQQCASLALSTMVLGEEDAIKQQLKAERDNMDSILVLLNSSNEECVHNSVHIIGSLMENHLICDYLVQQDCIRSMTKIFSFASIEIKRACGYVFSILVEREQYHEDMKNAGALQKIVNLSALVDVECQLYGAFSLVFLASNKRFQVPLVKMGAVRPLVAMMATESEPRHYAGLALLKLADNFENHITIAEEGGIQALLKLGRSRATDEEVQYKAALTVGNLAYKAVEATKEQKGVVTSKFRRDRN